MSLRSHFFFFQAEDGIRDGHVTGVQTCALPICRRTETSGLSADGSAEAGAYRVRRLAASCWCGRRGRWRSEERRVGKECGARWGTETKENRGEDKSVLTMGEAEERKEACIYRRA